MSELISRIMYQLSGLSMILILIIVADLVLSPYGDSITPKPNNSMPQRIARQLVV
jgi:hypothetical protein